MTPLEWVIFTGMLLAIVGIMAWIWRSGRPEEPDGAEDEDE